MLFYEGELLFLFIDFRCFFKWEWDLHLVFVTGGLFVGDVYSCLCFVHRR